MLCLGLESRVDAAQASLEQRLVHLNHLPDAQRPRWVLSKGCGSLCAPFGGRCDLEQGQAHLDVLVEFLQGSAGASNTVRLEPSLDLGLSAWAPKRSDLASCDGKNAGVLTASIQLFFVSHGQPFLEEFGERSSCLRVIGVFFLEADSTLYGGQEFAY